MELYSKELIEKHGGFALEKQLFFANRVGKMGWDINLNEGAITFDDGTFYPMQILGTFSHSSKTWLWGWTNTESNIPENLLEQSQKLKEYGTLHKIDFFTNEEFEIEKDDVHYIGLVALGMFNQNGYYLANYGSGTMCLTISSESIDENFPNDHHSIFTVFPQLLFLYEINHRKAFLNYLTQKGYNIEKTKNKITGINGENKVKAIFDNLDRLKELK
jgi:hypothetical protein